MPLLDAVLDRSLIGYSRAGYAVRRHHWPADPAPDALAGKVAVVTGARSGLGAATVAGLARLGARVHMVVRDTEAAAAARDEIAAEVPGADLVLDQCDVASIRAVKAYGARFAGPLHVLVHNAGVLPPERDLTAEGHELTYATHVLGPHALTRALLGPLREGAPSRVIWVTSGGMYAQPLPLGDLEYAHDDYRGATAYARTKRMQVELAREWGEHLAGQGISVHSVHPGWAATPGLEHSLPRFATLARPILRTPEQGADTIVWLAAADAPQTTTGRLWHDRRTRPDDYLPRTRTTAGERAELWGEVEAQTG